MLKHGRRDTWDGGETGQRLTALGPISAFGVRSVSCNFSSPHGRTAGDVTSRVGYDVTIVIVVNTSRARARARASVRRVWSRPRRCHWSSVCHSLHTAARRRVFYRPVITVHVNSRPIIIH